MFQHFAYLRHSFFKRKGRPGIIGRRLDAALEQFAAQIGMGFQLLMLAQDHEHGFGRIKELALFNQVEQPQGQRRRQIGFKPQTAFCDLVAEPVGLFDGMGFVGGIGPFGYIRVGHGFIAFPPGHRLSQFDKIPVRAIDGEVYLRRVNCEYWDYLSEICDAQGVKTQDSYSSEREDWIQNLVAGGLGICFIPEYSAVVPGLQVRPVTEPEVSREVCLVTVAGRRFSPAVSAFVKAVKSYSWATPPSSAD